MAGSINFKVMLLPPFVPPSARIPVAPNPLATSVSSPSELPAATLSSSQISQVSQDIETLQASQNTVPQLETVETVVEYSASLPSIEEFVLRAPYEGTAEEPVFVSTTPTTHIPESIVLRDGTELVQLGGLSSTSLEEAEENNEQKSALGSESFVADTQSLAQQNQAQTPAAPEAPLTTGSAAPESPLTAVSAGAEEPAGWVAEERDSFDWNAVAQLAAQAEPLTEDEAARAEAEWLATDWGAIDKSSNEQVASILMKLAKRIKAGQLEVDVQKQATTEAALISVLSALLSKSNLPK